VSDVLGNAAASLLTVPVISGAGPVTVSPDSVSLVYVVNDLDRALQYVQVQQKYAHDVCGAMIDLCTNATLLDASVIQRMWNRIDLDTDVIDTSTWLINETVHHTDVVAGDAWDAALWENAAQAYFLVADAVVERGFRNLDEHVWVNRLILSNEYLVLMHRANEDTARRRLQSSGTSVSDLHASTDELVDAIYASLQLGESYGVTYDYYSMSVAKGWPTNNYLPASDVDWFVMNTSTAFSDEAIAYGMSSVKSGTGSSNCSDPALGCDIHSDTLSSSVYIVTARDLTASPDMELAILANNIDSIVIDPTPVSYSADCDGAPNVTFACNQDNETWGHPYVTETLTCAGYGSWYYTCPLYSITYECESNANCTVQESVTGALTCLCSVGYEASSPTAVLGSTINNFDTYVRSVVNSAVYSKRVVSPSSAEFTETNSGLDSDEGIGPEMMLSILLPVLVFICCCLLCLLFFCMTQIKYDEEWKKINNETFGLRDYVNQFVDDSEVDLDELRYRDFVMPSEYNTANPEDPLYTGAAQADVGSSNISDDEGSDVSSLPSESRVQVSGCDTKDADDNDEQGIQLSDITPMTTHPDTTPTAALQRTDTQPSRDSEDGAPLQPLQSLHLNPSSKRPDQIRVNPHNISSEADEFALYFQADEVHQL